MGFILSNTEGDEKGKAIENDFADSKQQYSIFLKEPYFGRKEEENCFREVTHQLDQCHFGILILHIQPI